MSRDLLSSSPGGFHELIETVPDAIMLLDPERGVFVDGNRNACEILGLTREEFLRSGPAETSPETQPDGRPSLQVAREHVEGALAGEAPHFEWVHLHKSGRPIYCEIRLMRFESAGRPLVCGSITDISARRRAEQELRLTRYAVDTAHLTIMWVRWDGSLRYANDAACRSLGYTRDELLALHVSDFDPDSQPGREERLARLLEDGSVTFESRHRRKDGSLFPVEVHATFVEYGDDRLTFNFITDISARKAAERALRRSEEQLRHALRMEAVGRLASGIAHDFNNLLTIIGGFAELAATELEAGHPAAESIARVRDAVAQAESVTGGLLTFARQDAVGHAPVLVEDVLVRSHDLIARTLPASIAVELDLEGGRGAWVKGDGDQLGQVLMNLALNARDAMAEGGRLTIVLGSDADRVRIAFSDTGCGVPLELRGRIFEPYFTTKPRGKGTGLGLSVLHGIVEGHDGTVEVHPRDGSGSTFVVTLPRVAAPLAGAAPAAAAPVRAAVGRVLSVEDEPLVARLVLRALTERGFDVEQHADGHAALEAFLAAPRTFDCFVLDHDLPGMSGVELGGQIRAARCDAPILIVTGDPTVDVSGVEGALLVPKPFSIAQLADTIASALSARPVLPG